MSVPDERIRSLSVEPTSQCHRVSLRCERLGGKVGIGLQQQSTGTNILNYYYSFMSLGHHIVQMLTFFVEAPEVAVAVAIPTATPTDTVVVMATAEVDTAAAAATAVPVVAETACPTWAPV